MKAAVFEELGRPDVVRIEEMSPGEPGDGQALIKVTSAGVNRADLLFLAGRYYRKPSFPSRLGKEAAGSVQAAGPNTSLKVGDRVALLPAALHESQHGGFAEYVVAPETVLIKSPESVADEIAGAIWMSYLTAWGALNHTARVERGQHVVVTAASSSVGTAAIQIVNALGGIPIATTTSADKVNALKELGAPHVIDVNNDDYVAGIRKLTDGRGADLIFDAVAGKMMDQHLRVCKQRGRILVYGVLDLSPMVVNPGVLVGKGAFVHGHSIITLYEDQAALGKAVTTITHWLDEGKFRPVIDRRFPLSDVQQALRYMQSNRQIGKIVVNP